MREKIKKFYRDMINHYSMQKKLRIFFVVNASVSIIILGVAAYAMTYYYLLDAAYEKIDSTMEQTNYALDSMLELYVNKGLILYNSQELQDTLLSEYHTISERQEALQRVGYSLNQITNEVRSALLKNSYYFGGTLKARLYTVNEGIYSNGIDVLSLSEMKEEEWYKKFVGQEHLYGWLSPHQSGDPESIILNQRILDYSDRARKEIGLLQIVIPVVRIEQVLGKSGIDDYEGICYSDENGDMIAFTGNGAMLKQADTTVEPMETVKINKKKYLVGHKVSAMNGWELSYYVPKNAVTGKMRVMGILVLLALALSITLSNFGARFLSRSLTRRMDILVGKMDRLGRGKFSVKQVLEGTDEIARLDQKFNSMALEIDDLIEKNYKQQLMGSKAKFELLQEQINPHLLYNTLTMISAVAEADEEWDIVTVAGSLTGFYKGVLNKGRSIETIGDELTLLKQYVEISSRVYSTEIDLTVDVEPRILEYYTIKLLLQPLVENAFLHGLQRSGGGVLLIEGVQEDSKITFTIFDDGEGMEESVVESLNTGSGAVGYGITNVRNRLKLFYGDRGSLIIESVEGAGTTAVISFPAMSEEEIVLMMKEKFLE